MRKPLIAGNWKMHGSVDVARALAEEIKTGAKAFSDIEVLLIPTYVHLGVVHTAIQNSAIKLGAQNIYPGTQGAFTGEVSGTTLKDIGCEYVLIGHSERRAILREDLPTVAAKFKAAVEAGLKPILCVGETRAEREAGMTEAIIREQLESVIHLVKIKNFNDAVIAYEPVWAIGTGLTATPDQAQAVHAFIRERIAQNHVDLAQTIRILYGGSVKPDNAESLFAMPDIDGGLIGGASLDAKSFLAICKAGAVSVACPL